MSGKHTRDEELFATKHKAYSTCFEFMLVCVQILVRDGSGKESSNPECYH